MQYIKAVRGGAQLLCEGSVEHAITNCAHHPTPEECFACHSYVLGGGVLVADGAG